MNTFIPTLFYSSVAGAATILGLLLVLWQAQWAKRNSIYLISFAAGVLLTTAFLNLLPESIELTKSSSSMFLSPYFFLLLGFAMFYILEQAIVIHTCQEEGCNTHSFGIIAAIGIAFHSLIDGVIIGIGFEVDYRIGLVSTVAVLVHELPEGIFTLGILLHAKMAVKKAVFYTVIVALATPVGAVVANAFAQKISLLVLGNIIAFAAGTFFYIGASDLLPQTHQISRKANVPLVIFLVIFGGLFIIFLSTVLKT